MVLCFTCVRMHYYSGVDTLLFLEWKIHNFLVHESRKICLDFELNMVGKFCCSYVGYETIWRVRNYIYIFSFPQKHNNNNYIQYLFLDQLIFFKILIEYYIFNDIILTFSFFHVFFNNYKYYIKLYITYIKKMAFIFHCFLFLYIKNCNN